MGESLDHQTVGRPLPCPAHIGHRAHTVNETPATPTPRPPPQWKVAVVTGQEQRDGGRVARETGEPRTHPDEARRRQEWNHAGATAL